MVIDHFNRPWDVGRVEAVLILLDHSFEMLIKAAIRHKGGTIREPRAKQTIGFKQCVRKALTEGSVQFLNEDQVLTLQTINGLRDAAQHYLIDVSEHQLYIHAQSGVTLFKDIIRDVFGDELMVDLPERVLPISTSAPRDLVALFDQELDEIRQLLRPGTRKKMEAAARLRSLAVLEGTINGEYEQPSDNELRKLSAKVATGTKWRDLFPGVAAVNFVVDGDGPSLSLRLTKKEGIPVNLVREGEGGGAVVALKRVNELDFYSLGLKQLAKKVGLTGPRALAVVRALELQADEDFFKEIKIGKAGYKRYSGKAAQKIREALPNLDMDEVWKQYAPVRRSY